uniref:Piwi domain-containing protein n=2 Tax=Odontella aurita TaxID=265563 RepID=A0A7S4IPA8_9STRA|mmetsp:Transcript_28121/g.82766  ORF Transcript_28121/g.82766 Transcript_28121/m.82766 type:complete len:714 (+) Transcript_28121:1124-3265(+)
MPFLDTFFRVARRHRIVLPQNVDCVDAAKRIMVSGRAQTPNEIRDKMGEAITRAKEFFLFDKDHFFQDRHVFFKSRASNPTGGLSDCLVIPPPPHVHGEVALILPRDEVFETHTIVNRSNDLSADARMMAVFKELGTQHPVDPFNYFFDANAMDQQHKVRQNAGSRWQAASFVKFVYLLKDGTIVEESEIRDEPEPAIIVPEKQVDSPLVFVHLEDDSKMPYAVAKMAAHFIFGVQSQCVVRQKFARQRGNKAEQYCSNVCLKVNTKLADKVNQGRAWDTHFRRTPSQPLTSHIPWVHEVPTLVIGLGCSKGIGQDSVTVIGASAALDTNCMIMAQDMKFWQSKASKSGKSRSLISSSVLIHIIKSLFVQFYLFRDEWPKRILYYREGLSEGFSTEAINHEMRCIRKGCQEVLSSRPEFGCPNEEKCSGRGCIFCTPLITFVVCHTNTPIKIVPREESDGNRGNVWSGTCVDKTIVRSKESFSIPSDFAPSKKVALFSGINDSGRDFVLIAQGGMKGTSKPVKFSVFPNENLCYRNSDGTTPLTKELLEDVTYQTSFQYGTATKAVRLVPVLYYSKRLAELGIGYINYLRHGENNLVSVPANAEDGDEEELMFIRKEVRCRLQPCHSQKKETWALFVVAEELMHSLPRHFCSLRVSRSQRRRPLCCHILVPSRMEGGVHLFLQTCLLEINCPALKRKEISPWPWLCPHLMKPG